MEIIALIKWLPQGGAAGAVIVVVWLFLKQQDKTNTLIQTVTDKFTATLVDHQEKSDDRLQAIGERSNAANASTQNTVNALVRDQIVSNTQMADAIRGLQAAVSELQKRDKA